MLFAINHFCVYQNLLWLISSYFLTIVRKYTNKKSKNRITYSIFCASFKNISIKRNSNSGTNFHPF